MPYSAIKYAYFPSIDPVKNLIHVNKFKILTARNDHQRGILALSSISYIVD